LRVVRALAGDTASSGHLGTYLTGDDAVLCEQRRSDGVVASDEPKQDVLGAGEVLSKDDGLVSRYGEDSFTLGAE
jgi:hypothetical protein